MQVGDRGEANSLPKGERGVSAEHPSRRHRPAEQLQDRDAMQIARERLFPRLVPENRAPGIGPRCAADQRAEQQAAFGYPPSPTLRAQLVDAEQHERPDVQDDCGGGDVDGGEEVGEGHDLLPYQISLLQGRDRKPCCESS